MEEAQVAGQLQHPGIVPVYEIGLQEDGRLYFAMKLVKGKTLSALIQDPAENRLDLAWMHAYLDRPEELSCRRSLGIALVAGGRPEEAVGPLSEVAERELHGDLWTWIWLARAKGSLRYVRERKLPRYASAGIPEVWIVDLGTERVEVYRETVGDRYRLRRTHERGEVVAQLLFPTLHLPIDEILL